MTPREVVAKAFHETTQPGGPLVPCRYDFGHFTDYDDCCECISIGAGIFERIRAQGWFLTTVAQQKHIWTEHAGDDAGVPMPFTCFRCAGLFDGIGEINP